MKFIPLRTLFRHLLLLAFFPMLGASQPGTLGIGTITNLPSIGEMELDFAPEEERIRRRALESQAEEAARAFLRRGEGAKAVETFRELGPDLQEKPVNRLGLAMAHMENGEYEKAEAGLQRLLESDPYQPIYLNNLAWMYVSAREVRFRDGAKAMRFAQRALMEAPRDPRIWNTLSHAYYLQEKYHEALRRSKQAVQLANAPGTRRRLVLDLQAQLERCENAVRVAP